MMLNVNYVKSIKNAKYVVTMYDIIPMIFPKLYFDHWPKEVKQEYEARLRHIAQSADMILFISESSKNDFLQYYPKAKSRCKTVYIGIDRTQYYYQPGLKNQQHKPFV